MAQKNNQKLRIGIVGAGSIVRQRHLPALKKNPDVEIVTVSNSTYESSEQFCKEHCKGATPMRNWADLLAVPDLDIIWIGTPPYMHSAVTISALEAGKHVFCQARMSMDLAEAEEMLAASKRFPELVTMLCPCFARRRLECVQICSLKNCSPKTSLGHHTMFASKVSPASI